ncbi:acetamidase [Pyrenophora tritici-repentis Pt-1C-BFP]|uniref:amidase n=1 Tax=Pyrenophora tritici-repentis (strain Pt-1C-BFP) TaxID=426418 RepID=B2VVW5_PYRTR|nr:acetamidase [Pyrenophora tritici-repentis Pt-1C-BFP]EDU40765.1 acetamidase [Pyrenophora tritici-repentis Pt-1C-BFP]
MASTSSWETKVAAKQQAAREKIPKDWLLPASVTDALQFPLSEHATNTFEIPRKSGLSCLTETYFTEAQERARFLDNERAQGRIVGPLHGLPVSVKDGFKIKGSASTIGYVSFLDHPNDTENSPLVDILLDLGAVIYVKTNLPQTLMTADSENNVFGRTLNPHNTTLTAGGSSGGEGALVGFRGSPLGIGTDIAGSIRIPALCCGTYGFKPTTARVPDGGQQNPSLPGNIFFNPSAGPLANDMPALDLLCKSVMSVRPALYDPTALDIPWRELPKPAPKLRLGLVAEDPAFPLHPPVKRALASAAKALAVQGHEIVPISADQAQVADSLAVAFGFFMLDHTGMEFLHDGHEPTVRSVEQSMGAYHNFKSTFLDDIAAIPQGTMQHIAALNVKRELIQDNWRKIWKNQRLDAVIGPSAQNTAIPHDTYGLPPYTLFLNVLDYPAAVLPFGKADATLDAQPLVMRPGQNGPDYHPKASHGAPLSVQVFTNKMRDEECLQVAAVVDECLKAVQ